MDVHVCSSVWHGSRGASGAFSLDRGRQVYLWCCDRNLGQILRDYQRQMESPPIIGFFYGVIGYLFLVDFITDHRLRKRAFFLI